jgi:hypothetical protein
MRPDLEAIQARVDAADKGPWGEHSLYVHNATGAVVAALDWNAATREEYEELKANSKFISHARTDVPALLAYVAELEGERDVLRDQVAGRDEQIGRVRELHRLKEWQHVDGATGHYCVYCSRGLLRPGPCPTLVALDGDRAKETPEPLIDPDCRDGKCGSCVGGPCEHECHRETP